VTPPWEDEDASRVRPFAEKVRLLLEIVALYPRVRWLLARKGLPATVARLRAAGPEERRPTWGYNQQLAAARLGKLVKRVLHPLPFDSRCLMQSLVLTAMLARRGIDSSVVIGVKSDPEFAAHAWVESDGVALLPPGDYGRVVAV
jgi:hypothetical protein